MNETDAVPYVNWFRDQYVADLVGVRRVPTVRERVEQLKAFNGSSKDLVLGIETKSTSRLIGTIGLRDIDWTKLLGEVAIFIGEKKQWNKGYGTEAMKLLLKIGFKELNLKRIQLHVDPSNLRAYRVFKKVGFEEEGTSEGCTVMVKESSSPKQLSFADSIIMRREQVDSRWSPVYTVDCCFYFLSKEKRLK